MKKTTNAPKYIKGRGAQINTPNRFHNDIRALNPNVFDEEDFSIETKYIEQEAKSIVNKVMSPDVGMDYSLNPYQGCEHGCVYCYARNSHTFWGYSAGLDFETKIIVKKNAPQLLRKKLSSKSWTPKTIMISGNTDCYQPAEKKYKLTRQLLQVCLEKRHPVGLITKNSLITRDLDLLKELNDRKLLKVAMSINTISEEVRLFLEPRTATIKKRLQAVRTLADVGILVTVLAAPIIPGLTDHGILPLVKACAEAGANTIHHIIVRLNGDVKELFVDFIHKSFPDRASKIINQISSVHRGQLNDSEFGHRMRGSGAYADIISQQFKIARQKYMPNPKPIEIDYGLFEKMHNPQMELF